MGLTSGRKSREKVSALLLNDQESGLASLLIVSSATYSVFPSPFGLSQRFLGIHDFRLHRCQL